MTPTESSTSPRRTVGAATDHVTAQRVEHCRSCGGEAPRPFLTLGSTPIANRLVQPDDPGPDPAFPLEVGHCSACSLVQLTYELPEEAIFDEDYPYFSSYSETLRDHSEAHAVQLIRERHLDGNSLVVEVASNDGYLLRAFKERGIPVLGIEPTPGPAAVAREAGVPTVEAFFGVELARELLAQGYKADVVIANNVMAHVPNLNSFVAGMAEILDEDGIVSVENPNVWDLIEQAEFDTVYHEHFCYFSTLAVRELMQRHGLTLVDVERFPKLHGGTLRWRMSKKESPAERAITRMAAEAAAGLGTFDYYAGFGKRVSGIQQQLRELLNSLKKDGATIAAYGAAAKGATLLNSSGIDVETVEFVVDRNEKKQGKLVPKARIPILPAETLLEQQPDYTLLLVWNISEEVMRQQDEYRRRGGRFIIPVPNPMIV